MSKVVGRWIELETISQYHLTPELQAAINAGADVIHEEMHKITVGEVTQGYFTLAYAPSNVASVRVTPVNGPPQVNKQVVGATGVTPDYDVLNTNQLHINNNGDADGLSGDLKKDEVLIVTYERPIQVITTTTSTTT